MIDDDFLLVQLLTIFLSRLLLQLLLCVAARKMNF